MDPARRVRFPAVLLALTALGAATGSRAGEDPLAAEIARWSAYVRDNSSNDEMWAQVKSASGPALAKAEEALRDGRRLLALQRLAAARVNPAAFRYLETLSPADRKELSKLESEWARSGRVLRADLGKTFAAAFAGVQPAAVRAIAEAALPQVRVYYDASLEYGRNTMPDAGFYYLGAARAQRETAELCRRLSAPSSIRPPALRPLGAELDALEGELLGAYRPPASIEKHADFIAASALLKEARELDAAGLRHGAVLRYLLAAQRTALIRASAPELDATTLAARLRERFGPDRLELVVGDALAFDFASLGRRLRVVGNLPYNISSPLLFHLAAQADALRDLTVMLQREVVARMTATPATAEYGRLTVMLQATFSIERLFVVPPGAFQPAPKVDSAVARLVPLAEKRPRIADPARFERVVAAAFSQRRKTLRNALAALVAPAAFAAAGIDPQRRGETLSVHEFVALADAAPAP